MGRSENCKRMPKITLLLILNMFSTNGDTVIARSIHNVKSVVLSDNTCKQLDNSS